MPTPSATYLSCKSPGTGRPSIWGKKWASLLRSRAGAYVDACWAGRGKALAEVVSKTRADAAEQRTEPSMMKEGWGLEGGWASASEATERSVWRVEVSEVSERGRRREGHVAAVAKQRPTRPSSFGDWRSYTHLPRPPSAHRPPGARPLQTGRLQSAMWMRVDTDHLPTRMALAAREAICTAKLVRPGGRA